MERLEKVFSLANVMRGVGAVMLAAGACGVYVSAADYVHETMSVGVTQVDSQYGPNTAAAGENNSAHAKFMHDGEATLEAIGAGMLLVALGQSEVKRKPEESEDA